MNRRGWFGMLAALALVPKSKDHPLNSIHDEHTVTEAEAAELRNLPVGRLKYLIYDIELKPELITSDWGDARGHDIRRDLASLNEYCLKHSGHGGGPHG